MDSFATSRATPQALVTKLAANCIGAHFSNEHVYGKTTHAYLFKASPHAKGLSDLLDEGERRGIYDLRPNGRGSTTSRIFLRALLDHTLNASSSVSLAPKSSYTALEPVTVTVKGSIANCVATRCAVRGFYQKTRACYQLENELVGHIISSSARPGYSPDPGTAAHRLQNAGARAHLSRSPTSDTFFMAAGFWKSPSMATAFLNVWVAYTTLKESYNDSGRQFRDNNSRKLAQTAFDDAMHCMLYTIKV